jgi:hypothetical protein
MAGMATVDDAIELLRDPRNVKKVGDGSREAFSVKSDEVVRLLRQRGAESHHEALALIRQAARALGGDEVIVNRPSALQVDKFGAGPARVMPAFWIPVEE